LTISIFSRYTILSSLNKKKSISTVGSVSSLELSELPQIEMPFVQIYLGQDNHFCLEDRNQDKSMNRLKLKQGLVKTRLEFGSKGGGWYVGQAYYPLLVEPI